MSLLVVGSIGIDTVETPTEKRADQLGGSAIYFSYAASFYTKVHLVGVVGKDFPSVHRTLLESREIDLSGLESAEGKTFRWTGRYHENMIDRDTLKVDLNVFGSFDPKVPEAAREIDFLFLANGAPSVQAKVLKQMKRRPKFVAADTMDLWIETTRGDLEVLLKDIDALVINDSEARMMTGQRELLRAGLDILELGPPIVIIKKGEHGALVVTRDGHFAVPGFPLEKVVDPTGAGDTFAGGILGYLAETGDTSPANLRRAVAHGAVVASYTVQDFSLEQLKRIKRGDLDNRYAMLLDLVRIPE
ncbi:MAG: PfkB family carbohydrate kinase [Planctomycetes bacterium]|nr:PfkB family carbohydrate kinase [Planctomycetota bacterium]